MENTPFAKPDDAVDDDAPVSSSVTLELVRPDDAVDAAAPVGNTPFANPGETVDAAAPVANTPFGPAPYTPGTVAPYLAGKEPPVPPERQWDVFGRPLVGSDAERRGETIHPLSQAVLNNIDLNDASEIDSNRQAIVNTLVRETPGLSPELLYSLDDKGLANLIDRPNYRRMLEKESVTRRIMAENAEVAGILKGQIPILYAAEGAVSAYTSILKQRLVGGTSAEQQARAEIAANPDVITSLINAVARVVIQSPTGIIAEAQSESRSQQAKYAGDPIKAFVTEFSNAFGDGRIPDPVSLITGTAKSLVAAVRGVMTDPDDVKRIENLNIADYTAAVAHIRATTANYPQHRLVGRLQSRLPKDPNDVSGLLRVLAENPLALSLWIASTAAESAPAVAAGGILSALGQPGLGLTAMRAVSGIREFGNINDPALLEHIRKNTGIDLDTAAGQKEYALGVTEAAVKARSLSTTFRGRRAAAIVLTDVLAFAGLQRLSKAKTNVRAVARAGATGVFSEVSGEALAGIFTLGEVNPQDVVLEGILGSGGTSMVVKAIIAQRTDLLRGQEAENAKEWLKTGEALKDTLSGIPVAKLDTAAEVMEQKLEEDGIPTVYILADELKRFDQDGAVQETLGLDPAAVAAAAAEGGVVEIDSSTFIRHILGKEGFDALLKHTTDTPGVMTPSEAEQYTEDGVGDQIQKALDETVRSRLGVTEKAFKELSDDIEIIRDDVAAQLQDTGSYDAEKSSVFAVLHAQRYAARAVAMSEETGEPVSALSLYEAGNLQIAGPGSAVQVSALEQSLTGTGRVSLTPAETVFFDEILGNDANRSELIEAVPSLRVENGELFVAAADIDAFMGEMAGFAIADGARTVPPRLRALTASRDIVSKMTFAQEKGRLRSVWDRVRGKDAAPDTVTLRHGGRMLDGNRLDVSRASTDPERSILGRGIYFASDPEGARAQIHKSRLKDEGRLYELRLPASAMEGVIDGNARLRDADEGVQTAIVQIASDLGVELDLDARVEENISRLRKADPDIEERLNAAGISGLSNPTLSETVIWDQALLDSAELFDISASYTYRPVAGTQPIRLRRDDILEQSAAELQEQPLTIVGTGPGGRVLNRDIGKAFTDRHMAAYGRALDPSNPADYAIMLDSLLADYAEQSRQPDSGDSWYTDDIAEAVRLTEYIYPELANPQFRDLFLTTTALLSPQQKPGPNWENAILALRSWKETGRVDLTKPSGAKFGVNTKGLQLLQHLIDTKGLEGAMRWVQEEHTGTEMAEIRRDSGLFVEKPRLGQYTPSELNLKSVTLGIYMFGPKVGDFMQNSAGIDQNAVTVDLWAARSYNRYVGRLLDTPDGNLVGDVRGAKERNQIKRLIRDAAEQAGIDPSAMQAALWYFEQRLYRSHGVKAVSQNFSGAAETALKSRGLEDALRTPVSYQQDSVGDAGKSPSASPARPVATEGGGPGDVLRAGAVGRGELGAGQEGVPAAPLQPLPGAPKLNGEQFGPIPELVSAAEAYADKAGIRYTRQPVYVPITPSRSERIAQAYEAAEHEPKNPDVRRAYRALITQTKAQYDALIEAGYTFTFFDNSTDPYDGNPWNAMRDLRDNKTMAVYSTLAGYGTDQTSDPSDHMLLEDTGLTWKDQNGNDVKVLANDLFRAVHDAFGHGLEGAGFRSRGEENAWQSHARLFTGEAVKALTTETRGQNSWLNYGPYGEQNRTADLEGTVFSDQKMALLPSWVSSEGAAGVYGLPVNEDGTVTLTHFSETAGLTQLDPSRHGTGMAGDEGARKSIEGWVDRTYFGVSVGKEGGYVSEFPAGAPSYEARVPADSLYDYQQDPDGLLASVKEQAITQRRANGDHLYDQGKLATLYEKAISDAGYEGYFNNSMQGLTVAKFTQTEVTSAEAPVLEQQRGATAGPRGGFTPSDLITDQDGKPVNLLQIFEKADPSTLLHESGHFWLEQLKADAAAVGGRFERDFKIVTDWWASRPLELREEAVRRAKKKKDKDSVAALQQMTEAQVSAYARSGELRGEGPSFYLSVAMHEQFARGVENYFATARAPSLALGSAFSSFKVWLGSVYTKLAGLDVKFSPEVTAVLDRMLASDAEIAMVEGQYELVALLDTAQQAGMTPVQFAAYQRTAAEAEEERRARHLAKHVREERRTRTKEWEDQKERLRAATEEEVSSRQPYRLIYALTDQGRANGAVLEEGEQANRMDRAILKELMETNGFSLDDLPRGGSNKVVYEKDGIAPGIIAAVFGYEDVDSMILDLVDTPAYADAVEQSLTEQMIEENGSIETSGQGEALASAYSDKTAQVMEAELRALRTTEPAFKIAFVRQYARERLLAAPTAEAKPFRYLQAERKHAKMAGDALKVGDKTRAYKHQFQRLVNHYMAREALKAEKDIQRKRVYLRGFTKRGKKFGKMEAGYADSIKNILSTISFETTSGDQQTAAALADLQTFIEQAEAADGSMLSIPAWMTASGRPQNVREMSYQQFLELHETVKRYATQGTKAKKIRVGQEDMDRALVVANLLVSLDGRDEARVNKLRAKGASKPTVAANGVVTAASYAALSTVAGIDAQLLKVEALLEAMDGQIGGVWWSAIYQPFNDAAAAKQLLTRDVSQAIALAIKAMPADVRKNLGRKIKPELLGGLGKPGMSITRGNLIMLALNMGNESNLDKLIRGMGGDVETNVKGAGWVINEDLLNTATYENLTQEEWNLIKTVWEKAELMWPTVEAIYRREHGESPSRIEGRTVKTKFGDIEGGYFPIMYDRTIAGVASDLNQKTALELMQAEAGRASVNSSMVKARTGYAAPVDVDFARMSMSFDNTIHFITHYEAVRNANKILGDREIKDAVENKMGIAYLDQLKGWVAALASNGNDAPPVNIVGQIMQGMYQNTTVAVLGLSYSTLGMQVLGVINGSDRIMADTSYGPRSIVKVQAAISVGYAKALDPTHVEFVKSVSTEMAFRVNNMDQNISEAQRRLTTQSGVRADAQRASMSLIAYTQFYTVDLPIWTAAYNIALEGNPDDTAAAVVYADRVIRLSQSSSGLKDQAAIQREKGLYKGLLMFYSWFSAFYATLRGVGVELSDNVRSDPAAAITRAASRMFVLFVLTSLGQGLVKGDLPDELDPEDEDAEGLLGYIARESALTALGTLPIIREVATGTLSDFGYKGGAGAIAIQAGVRSFKGLTKIIDEYGEDATDESYGALAKKAAPFVLLGSVATGTPGAIQLNRFLDGLAALYDEEDNWMAQDLLRGYRPEEAARRED